MNDLKSGNFAERFGAIWAAWAVLLLATPLGAQSEERNMTLRNGAEIKAEVVKETSDKVFVDFGFDLFGMPRAEILSMETPAERQEAAEVEAAYATDDASAPRGESWEEISLSAAANRRKRNSVEVLSQSKKGVVIVSTPGGFGAGYLIDRTGLIVTNQHVILGEKYVDVTLMQRKRGRIERRKIKSAELLAMSPLMDIALIKIPEEELEGLELEPLPLSMQGSLSEGDSVYAIGNPGMGREILDHTLSQGIVSSLARNFSDILYIQTTAAVNPGNSGGPLINEYGEVVGLVSLKAVFQEGIAFALPIDYIRFFLRHQKAYAYGKANPNTGIYYITPD